MPIKRRFVYLDHAAVGPLSGPARTALSDWLRQATELGDVAWPSWERRAGEVRQLAAELINAEPAEVALVANTTSGIGVVAEGINWREGDNVVTLANEFPSNAYPWLNLKDRGVETRLVETEGGAVDLARIEAACDRRTRLIAVSWIGYASGWRIDPEEIARLARRKKALFLLDAIQGLGVFPLDVKRTEVDFVAADGHKWMLGPEGAGLLYIRQDRLEELRPTGVGWNSVRRPYDFAHIEADWKPTAARFEGGSRNMAGYFALGASLELLRSAGLSATSSAVADRVLTIADYAAGRLEQLGAEVRRAGDPARRSGIVGFRFAPCDPAKLRKRCLEAGVVVSCRGGGLRISPHAYNTQAEIDYFIDVVRRAVGQS